jgi:stage II sporulation protein D
MKKTVLLVVAGVLTLVTVTILLPSALIAMWPDKNPSAPANIVELKVEENDIPVKVYLKDLDKTVTLPLEKYVRGVVAAEMPVTFEKEALKAQAMAARTYIVRRLLAGTKTPQGADVTNDHNDSQAYSTDEKLQQRWGLLEYTKNLSKINEAVNETKGKVIVYQGQPIEALFFSTSSGATENSEDYWGKKIPYLRSVNSPWDEQSDKYTDKLTVSLADLREKLGIHAVLTSANLGAQLQPLEKTATEHVKKIRVGDKTFSGPEFRTALGLRSTWFTWQVAGDTITFFTRGFGHGVGLSQYGANGMAKEGKKAEEIVRYYYQGVEIADAKGLLGN